MKSLFLTLAFLAFTSPALGQHTVNIGFEGDHDAELMNAIGIAFRALDDVLVVAESEAAELVVIVIHAATDKGPILSVVIAYPDDIGQLVFLAHKLYLGTDAPSAAAWLAGFFDESIMSAFR